MTDRAAPARPSRPYRPPDDPRLPRFPSYEEEAEFWESHDFETLEPVPTEELAERRAIEDEWRTGGAGRGNLSAEITVRLDRATYDAIVTEARNRRMRPAALAREWLRERLRSS